MANLTKFSQQLRNNPTKTEKILWNKLKQRQIYNYKFRRQQQPGKYIVDFVCLQKKLIIECDGGQHMENKDDIKRDLWLKNEGFEVLRFWNNEIHQNIDGVIAKISEKLGSPTP